MCIGILISLIDIQASAMDKYRNVMKPKAPFFWPGWVFERLQFLWPRCMKSELYLYFLVHGLLPIDTVAIIEALDWGIWRVQFSSKHICKAGLNGIQIPCICSNILPADTEALVQRTVRFCVSPNWWYPKNHLIIVGNHWKLRRF